MPSLPSKKRKAGAEASTSGVKIPAASTSTPGAKSSEDFHARLQTIQAALSSSQDLNPLADLVELVSQCAFNLGSDALIPALTLLLRTLVHLVRVGHVPVHAIDEHTGLLTVAVKSSSDPQQQVQAWIKGRFNASVMLLARIMSEHTKEKSRVAGLNALMELQRACVGAISVDGAAAKWPECPWRSVVRAVFASQDEAVRNVFVTDYVEKYADVKMAFYRAVRRDGGASRSNTLAVLMALSNPPTSKAAIKDSDYFVDAFSVSPGGSAGKKSKKKAAAKKSKFSEDGDSSSDGDDDESDEEDEDINWFSDSGDEDEQEAKTSTTTAAAARKRTGPAPRRQRRSAASQPLHSALYEPKAWKVTLDAAWLTVLLSRGDANPPLMLGEINSVLRVMEKRILPFLTKPQLIADWLLDCLDVGGSTALLSLSPLYTLYVSYSLSLPSLYSTLYTLLTPALLHSPHRSHSLRLLALFLSSDKLPLTTVLAFLKRLSRCALRGPPGGIIPVTIMCYNLLKRHKEGMHVLHRDDVEEGWVDQYVSSLSCAPSESHAQHTSLLEFSSLGALNPNAIPEFLEQHRPAAALESHYHAATTTIVKILAQPFTKESYDVEEFLDHGYASLIKTEVERSGVGSGAEESEGKKRKRSANPPAVRFSLADSTGKRKVRVFPRRRGGEEEVRAGKRALESTEAQTQPSTHRPRTGFAPAPDADADDDHDAPPPPGLDAEELEAYEAMREVEREQRAQEDRKVAMAPSSRRDVLALWAY